MESSLHKERVENRTSVILSWIVSTHSVRMEEVCSGSLRICLIRMRQIVIFNAFMALKL